MSTLMSLGEFVFEQTTLPYAQLARQNDWRHPGTDRVSAAPAYQSLGPGAETFAITGIVYAELGNREGLDTLRDMADAGDAYALVDAAGKVYGMYVINTISETGSYFNREGVAKKTEFTINITRADTTPTDQKTGKGNKGSKT